MKFFFIRATMVNGMNDARRRSAHARFTKYLLFVNRMGPRDPNITRSAAKFPNNARMKIEKENTTINHSPSLVLPAEFVIDEDERFLNG